ncbi:MAG: restriction endonuclease subunit S [Pseudomonadaceae bacterium]|nr:restriction endonuclease subunit S [Pseudomonadaceae bacterium]
MQSLVQMPKYDAYKSSGEDWISDIPEHWEIEKLKHLFYEKKHTQNMTLNCGSISFGKVVRKDDEKVPLSTKASYQEVLTGEFLINPLNLNFDLISLRIALSKINVVVSAGYIVLKEKVGISRDYFNYFFHRYDVAYMKLLGSGVRQTISFNHIANSLLVFPPKAEQIAIAQFLDEKTGQIDEAIAIKEKQITLLKERKQIIIQKAVTQGLNPNAPLKDSGVDWIGQIPQHWEVKKLRYLGRTQNGVSAGAEYFGEGYPFVSYGDVYKNRQLPMIVDGLAKSSFFDQVSYSVRSGDVFFTRTSETIDEIGFASICFKPIEKATFAGFLIRFRPTSDKLTKEFSKYYFNAPMMREYFVKEMNLVIRASLSQELLKNLLVVLPKVDEQIQIFEYLEDMSAKIDASIELQIEQIEKLKEYKTTLINSAVTGKIKVT